MTDHFICICLVFCISQEKAVAPEESDLCDVFFDFVCCHTKTGINEFHSFFFRIYDNLNRSFVIFRKSIFTHDFQFFSLVMASHPLDTSSRMKISWSEYNHFFIIGNILSLSMDKLPVPFCITHNRSHLSNNLAAAKFFYDCPMQNSLVPFYGNVRENQHSNTTSANKKY